MAIGFVGSWAAGEGTIEYPDMKFDYVQIPPYFGTEHKFAADSGWGKVVSVNTKHPAEAWKLAKFMAAEQESALTWNIETKTIPAMKKLVENPDKLLAAAPFIEATFGLLPVRAIHRRCDRARPVVLRDHLPGTPGSYAGRDHGGRGSCKDQHRSECHGGRQIRFTRLAREIPFDRPAGILPDDQQTI